MDETSQGRRYYCPDCDWVGWSPSDHADQAREVGCDPDAAVAILDFGD